MRVDGREEVFVILRVDKTRNIADLLRLGAVHKVESGVPLSLLRVAAKERPFEERNLTEQAS